MKLTLSISPPSRPRKYELCELIVDTQEANSAQHAHYIRYSVRRYRKVPANVLARLRNIQEFQVNAFVHKSVMASLDVVAEHGQGEKVAAVLMSLNIRNNRAIVRLDLHDGGYNFIYEVKQLTSLPTEETLILIKDLEKWLYQDIKHEYRKSKITDPAPSPAGNSGGEVQ